MLTGSALSLNWRAEVVQRADGRLVDVAYYSPSGIKFRSDPEVYRHLGLPVSAGAGVSAKSKKRGPSSSDGRKVLLIHQVYTVPYTTENNKNTFPCKHDSKTAVLLLLAQFAIE